jgi:hypothetical protein
MNSATPIPHSAVLVCHPETPSQAVRRVQVSVCRIRGGMLTLTFALEGDLARLCIPPPRPPRWADRLWQHTCFEAFVAMKGKPAYYEFNFAPSGEWAAYAFRRYRDGMPLEQEELAPGITTRNVGERLELDVIIRLDRLPTIQPRTRLQLALSAVVEEENGVLSYWALKHPPGKPDFHHPDAFALELEPPDVNLVTDPTFAEER